MSTDSSVLEPITKTTLLWYCDTCTCLILPGGSPGVVNESGAHFCNKCAPPVRRGSSRIALAAVDAVEAGMSLTGDTQALRRGDASRAPRSGRRAQTRGPIVAIV